MKSIYFGELGILPAIGRDCYQQKLFFVWEFRWTYDIKLTSACNGLLLFAKEEYKIYRSENVVGGLSGIGKMKLSISQQLGEAFSQKKEKKEKEGSFRGDVIHFLCWIISVFGSCLLQVVWLSLKVHSRKEWYNTIRRKLNANVSADFDPNDAPTKVFRVEERMRLIKNKGILNPLLFCSEWIETLLSPFCRTIIEKITPN